MFLPIRWVFAAVILLLFAMPVLHAQTGGSQTSPSDALASALTAACREDATAFGGYLTAPNVPAFRALPPMQQTAMLKRFVLLEDAGKALLSTGGEGRPVLR